MGIHNWLEKRKRKKTPAEPSTAELKARASHRIEPAPGPFSQRDFESNSINAAARQQQAISPFEGLFAKVSGVGTAHTAHEAQLRQTAAHQAMMARMAPSPGLGLLSLDEADIQLELLSMDMDSCIAACVGSCQPHRGGPEPGERKHVDSVVVPQKCLPEVK